MRQPKDNLSFHYGSEEFPDEPVEKEPYADNYSHKYKQDSFQYAKEYCTCHRNDKRYKEHDEKYHKTCNHKMMVLRVNNYFYKLYYMLYSILQR